MVQRVLFSPDQIVNELERMVESNPDQPLPRPGSGAARGKAQVFAVEGQHAPGVKERLETDGSAELLVALRQDQQHGLARCPPLSPLFCRGLVSHREWLSPLDGFVCRRLNVEKGPKVSRLPLIRVRGIRRILPAVHYHEDGPVQMPHLQPELAVRVPALAGIWCVALQVLFIFAIDAPLESRPLRPDSVDICDPLL